MTKYDPEFRRTALNLSDEIGVRNAASQLKVPYSTLCGWRKKRRLEQATLALNETTFQPNSFRYQEIEAFFDAPVGGRFTYDNIDDLPEKLSDQKIEGFIRVEQAIPQARLEWLKKVDSNRPSEELALLNEHDYQCAMAAYQRNRDDGEHFFDILLAALLLEKKRRSDNEPRYEPERLCWETPYGVFELDDWGRLIFVQS